ncbi:DUF423 domain-containing protein [Paenimyroides tangerinum]|uniref:DUF423 domain-containing protein n=1 Tax=Paenimyroides tangerinum TaxID=2488728 RepID=A0A3P3W6R5_9FLAO|nr:DUF423 domain-containing protein [Paenimyroides tangerinum]RRJ90108.1 DUF423 domain-containing protein [Paenimyroides tangerinum]
MNTTIIIVGAIFGALSVILGAFGAHAFKKFMNEEQLKNYETGIKYQMYHAILLIVIGFNADLFQNAQIILILLSLGILLFSFSIYGLTITSALNKKWRILGPITPIGGLLLVSGWLSIIINFI